MEEKLAHKDEVIAEIMFDHVKLKKSWGGLKAEWVPPAFSSLRAHPYPHLFILPIGMKYQEQK
ncbi:MAG: hypothetical protein E3K32_11620 [wastewater metagenome]|nr:hypothetical protein [Candidatus Loosdrechtia aerotolerans]